MRGVRMKRGGILYDLKRDKKITFESGDYILCGVNGVLRPMKSAAAHKRLSLEQIVTSAVCDECLYNLGNNPLELFGGAMQTLSPEQVRKWPVVKVKRA